MPHTVRVAVAVLLTAAVSGCSDGALSEGSERLDRPPELDTSRDAVVVVGAGTCSMRNEGFTEADGVFLLTERFVCEDVMSDHRVSGAHELVVVTEYVDENTGGVWTTESATLTNDEGAWRGSAWGVVDLSGVLPFAEGLWPFNYGEGLYFGEGAYEGLVYHWYIAGSNSESGLTGWIRSAAP